MAKQVRGGRTVVLNAATTLFHRVGYHGASIRDIAREADITVASIYYHFSSKQEILQEIMVGLLREVMQETRASVLAAGDRPEAQLTALMRAWVAFHIREQAKAVIGATEIRSLDDEGRAKIVALRDEQENLFRAVIDHGAQAGVFATPDPVEAARAVISLGRNIVSWYRPDGPKPADEFADQYGRFALALVEYVDLHTAAPASAAGSSRGSI